MEDSQYILYLESLIKILLKRPITKVVKVLHPLQPIKTDFVPYLDEDGYLVIGENDLWEMNHKRNYCYNCGTTVKNQKCCHECGGILDWKNINNNTKKYNGTYLNR